MEKISDYILRAGTIDRRWIFLIIGLAVLLPLFFPLGLPIRATLATQKVYDAVEGLETTRKFLFLLNMVQVQNLRSIQWL